MKILKRPEGHEDAGRYYLRIVIPAGRVPSKDQSPNGWAIYKSRSKILYAMEEEEKDEQVLQNHGLDIMEEIKAMYLDIIEPMVMCMM